MRDGYQVMLISTGGTVIKMPVEDVKRLGRSTQGVIVMRLRDGENVSSLAPVIDDDDEPSRAGGRRRSARSHAARRMRADATTTIRAGRGRAERRGRLADDDEPSTE